MKRASLPKEKHRRMGKSTQVIVIAIILIIVLGSGGTGAYFAGLFDSLSKGRSDKDSRGAGRRCDAGKAGPDCQYSDVTTCNANGTANDDGSCGCKKTFAGANCEYSDAQECNSNGVVNDEGQCECKDEWFSGVTASGEVKQCSLNPQQCHSHGEPSFDADDSIACACEEDWKGVACKFSDATSCHGGAVVLTADGTAVERCDCDENSTGSMCQFTASGVCNNGKPSCDACTDIDDVKCDCDALDDQVGPRCEITGEKACNGKASALSFNAVSETVTCGPCETGFAGKACQLDRAFCSDNGVPFGQGEEAEIDCTCDDGAVGDRCQFTNAETCFGKGTAVFDGTNVSCDCNDDFAGQPEGEEKGCRFSRQDTCTGKGTPQNDGSCECDDGAVGPNCQFTRDITCSGHGTPQDDGTCVCDSEAVGTACQFTNKDKCNGRGTISVSDDDTIVSCTPCDEGSAGVSCEFTRDNCSGNGNPTWDGLTMGCECDAGFLGSECQYSRETTCNQNGRPDAEGVCDCDEGAAGLTCNHVNYCNPENGGKLSNQPSQLGGVFDGENLYCICPVGVVGDECQFTSTECNNRGAPTADGSDFTGCEGCENSAGDRCQYTRKQTCSDHGEPDDSGNCTCDPCYSGDACEVLQTCSGNEVPEPQGDGGCECVCAPCYTLSDDGCVLKDMEEEKEAPPPPIVQTLARWLSRSPFTRTSLLKTCDCSEDRPCPKITPGELECVDGQCKCKLPCWSGSTCSIECSDAGKCDDGACKCEPGFAGASCELNSEYCSDSQGIPSNVEGGGVACDCKTGFAGQLCEVDSGCENEGQPTNVLGQDGGVYDGLATYCNCPPQTAGAKCEFTRKEHCNDQGNPRIPAEKPDNPLWQKIGQERGGVVCECDSEYQGWSCEYDSNYCNGGSLSIDDSGQPICDCGDAAVGSRCQYTDDWCENGGTVSVDENDAPICACPAGYVGKRCEYSRSDCTDHGTPSYNIDTDTLSCACDDGFAGDRCQFGDRIRCSGNGTVDADGVCECNDGFAGKWSLDEITSVASPGCRFSRLETCNNRGIAQDDGSCVCDDGAFGDACEWTVDTYCSGNADELRQVGTELVCFSEGNAGCRKGFAGVFVDEKNPACRFGSKDACNGNGEPYNDSKDTLMCDCDENYAGEPSMNGSQIKEQGCRFSNDSCQGNALPGPVGDSNAFVSDDGSCNCSYPEFAGPACQYSKEKTCHDHGYPEDDGTCDCDEGFGGPSTAMCMYGAENACSGNAKGISFDAYGFPICDCKDDYAGAFLQDGTMGCRFSRVLTCGGKGTPDDSGDCTCDPGFAGSSCQYSDEKNCNNGGRVSVCTDEMVMQAQNGCKNAGDPYCVCDACHKGATCNEDKIDCGNGTCQLLDFHSARCACEPGWYQKDPNELLSKCDHDTISACNQVVNTCIKRCDVDDVVVPCSNDKACERFGKNVKCKHMCVIGNKECLNKGKPDNKICAPDCPQGQMCQPTENDDTECVCDECSKEGSRPGDFKQRPKAGSTPCNLDDQVCSGRGACYRPSGFGYSAYCTCQNNSFPQSTQIRGEKPACRFSRDATCNGRGDPSNPPDASIECENIGKCDEDRKCSNDRSKSCLGDDECKGTCSNNKNLRCMNTAECMSENLQSDTDDMCRCDTQCLKWDGSLMELNARGCADYPKFMSSSSANNCDNTNIGARTNPETEDKGLYVTMCNAHGFPTLVCSSNGQAVDNPSEHYSGKPCDNGKGKMVPSCACQGDWMNELDPNTSCASYSESQADCEAKMGEGCRWVKDSNPKCQRIKFCSVYCGQDSTLCGKTKEGAKDVNTGKSRPGGTCMCADNYDRSGVKGPVFGCGTNDPDKYGCDCEGQGSDFALRVGTCSGSGQECIPKLFNGTWSSTCPPTQTCDFGKCDTSFDCGNTDDVKKAVTDICTDRNKCTPGEMWCNPKPCYVSMLSQDDTQRKPSENIRLSCSLRGVDYGVDEAYFAPSIRLDQKTFCNNDGSEGCQCKGMFDGLNCNIDTCINEKQSRLALANIPYNVEFVCNDGTACNPLRCSDSNGRNCKNLSPGTICSSNDGICEPNPNVCPECKPIKQTGACTLHPCANKCSSGGRAGEYESEEGRGRCPNGQACDENNPCKSGECNFDEARCQVVNYGEQYCKQAYYETINPFIDRTFDLDVMKPKCGACNGNPDVSCMVDNECASFGGRCQYQDGVKSFCDCGNMNRKNFVGEQCDKSICGSGTYSNATIQDDDYCKASDPGAKFVANSDKGDHCKLGSTTFPPLGCYFDDGAFFMNDGTGRPCRKQSLQVPCSDGACCVCKSGSASHYNSDVAAFVPNMDGQYCTDTVPGGQCWKGNARKNCGIYADPMWPCFDGQPPKDILGNPLVEQDADFNSGKCRCLAGYQRACTKVNPATGRVNEFELTNGDAKSMMTKDRDSTNKVPKTCDKDDNCGRGFECRCALPNNLTWMYDNINAFTGNQKTAAIGCFTGICQDSAHPTDPYPTLGEAIEGVKSCSSRGVSADCGSFSAFSCHNMSGCMLDDAGTCTQLNCEKLSTEQCKLYDACIFDAKDGKCKKNSVGVESLCRTASTSPQTRTNFQDAHSGNACQTDNDCPKDKKCCVGENCAAGEKNSCPSDMQCDQTGGTKFVCRNSVDNPLSCKDLAKSGALYSTGQYGIAETQGRMDKHQKCITNQNICTFGVCRGTTKPCTLHNDCGSGGHCERPSCTTDADCGVRVSTYASLGGRTEVKNKAYTDDCNVYCLTGEKKKVGMGSDDAKPTDQIICPPRRKNYAPFYTHIYEKGERGSDVGKTILSNLDACNSSYDCDGFRDGNDIYIKAYQNPLFRNTT